MKRKYSFSFVIFLIASLIITYFPGCGGSTGDISKYSSIQLIELVSQTDSSESRENALNVIISKSRSLGVLDENGNQINTNLPEEAISLTHEDIASLSTFIEMGHYCTIGSVVDFLAEAGVILDSTGDIITFEDLLPDLQNYVDWSFENKDNPDSTLGLLIAAGHSMDTVYIAPDIELTTPISHIAAMLMLADILIGVQDVNDTQSAFHGVNVAYASDLEKTAKRIQGLITKIESGLKPLQSTFDFAKSLGQSWGLVKPGQKTTKIIEIPDIAKQLLGAFAAGSHFSVRIQSAESLSSVPSVAPIVKSIELNQVGKSEYLMASLCLIPSGKSGGVTPTLIVQNVPVIYSIRLISPNEQGYGIDLYPDANAVLSPHISDPETQKIAANGHILDMGAYAPLNPAIFEVTAMKLENTSESRTAIMHVTATILTDDLGMLYEKYINKYAGAISALGLQPDEIKQMFDVMKTAIQVTPWMVEVILVSRRITIEPSLLSGFTTIPYVFTAKVENRPAGSHWSWEVFWEPEESGKKKEYGYGIGPDNVMNITFQDKGTYYVKATLLTNQEKLIGEAQAKAIIIERSLEADIELSIEYTPTIGETGCGVNFYARVTNIPYQELPDNIVWAWDFGDDKKDDTSGNNVSHVYEECGQYQVQLTLLDGNNQKLPANHAPVYVTIDDSLALQQTRWVEATLWALRIEESFTEKDGVRTKIGENQPYGPVGLSNRTSEKTLEWKTDNKFEVEWTVVGTDGKQTTNYRIHGRVSSCEKLLDYITIEENFTDPEYNDGKPWTRIEVLTLRDVPINKSGCGESVVFYIRLSGEEVRQYIERGYYEYESRVVDGRGDEGDYLVIFKDFNWDYPPHQAPELEIRFSTSD